MPKHMILISMLKLCPESTLHFMYINARKTLHVSFYTNILVLNDLLYRDVFGTLCTLAAVIIGDPSCTAFIASKGACFHCSHFLKGLLGSASYLDVFLTALCFSLN